MNRIVNFSAGPSTLPLVVLEEVGKEMSNYQGYGLSVMEMSHRSSSYKEIHSEAKDLLRKLMSIPENYEILFLQGGATTQFAAIPLNLLNTSGKADYIISGSFAQKAYKEALKYGDIAVAASSKDIDFSSLPDLSSAVFREDADYVHMCVNNTIYGTRFKPDEVPQTGNIPVAADMSSNILSEVYDVNDFGLIYAGAQKNIGPAGLTVVIIRNDLIGKANSKIPTILDYSIQAEKDSMYNTPPTFAIYTAGKVFKWIKNQGGIKAIEQINREKADLLYNYIDNSEVFKGTASANDRSIMNITFRTKSDETDKLFVAAAEKEGLINLKGHRSVGGMRASIYNAMPIEGVKQLVDLMSRFENKM